MKKTDGRHYNRRAQRTLKMEMDLFILLVGKHLSAPGSYNGLPYNGIITDVKYINNDTSRQAVCTLNNGTRYGIRMKNNKLIFDNENVKIA